MSQTREYYIKNVEVLTADELEKGIRNGIVEFDDLQKSGSFSIQKQKQVRIIQKRSQEEYSEFNRCSVIDDFQEFIKRNPESNFREDAEAKIKDIVQQQKYEQERMLEEIKNDINGYKPDELLKLIGEEALRNLCSHLDLNYDTVINFDESPLTFNDIPETSDDVPNGFTDIFLWGIPSSGKTTALSAILRTMKDKYSISSPRINTKFGSSYRDSLINIYKNGNTAYLPAATNRDRTQYMPFLLKRRKDNENKYRKTSFFELSGEVFKYFYEIINNVQVLNNEDRMDVIKAFLTLDLLLESNNQKIHFFLIDYNKETKGSHDNNNLSQENYLNAAAEYFRDKNNIFKYKTDAVYVILTKADEIKADDKTNFASQFLTENFGNFMDVLSTMCKENSIEFGVKIFSIGDVYFKGICKLNYKYSENIIDELLKRIRPENTSFWRNLFRR